MKVFDIINIIEKTAVPEIAASWDVSGIQVAALRKEVSSVAVMLDPTPENLDRAIAAGAGFVLTHHPLSMKPRFPNREDPYLAMLSRLFRNDVWLYSAHTSLDANPTGPVRWLAEELELIRITTLEPFAEGAPNSRPEVPMATGGQGGGSSAYGFGFTGTLTRPMSYADFCRKLASCLGRSEWQACGRRPEAVFRVACSPGSGKSLLSAAVAVGADVFISGDITYHTALDSLTLGMRVLDVGHFLLEEEMMRRFAKQLDRDLEVPVSFFPSRDPLGIEHIAS